MCTSQGGVAYGLGISQLAIMFGVVTYFPLASVQVCVYRPCVSNGTLTHACGSTDSVRLMLPLPCLAVSAAAAVFVSSTHTLAGGGVLSDETTYAAEAVAQAGLWDAMFWFVAAGAHAIAVLAACSPADAFAVGAAAYLMVHFLSQLCRPADERCAGGYQSADAGANMGGAGAGAMTAANANILGYMAGVGIAVYSVPAQYSNRLVILLLLVVMDYFLGVGHAWDRGPSMFTVANCRLFWVCSASLCLAALYGAWRDDLLMPVASAGAGG
jgi:hypothetical protein